MSIRFAPGKLTETNGIPSTKFTKIENNLVRTGSNDSDRSMGSDPYSKNQPDGEAMTKKRKYKNRKTKNRKTKNSKTKNSKKSTYIGGNSNKGFMDLLKNMI